MKTIAITSTVMSAKKNPLPLLWLLLSLLPGVTVQAATATPPTLKNTAFYYAAKPPTDILKQYQRVILESDNITAQELEIINSEGAETFAYLSVGEVSPTRKWYSDIQKSWILGHNNVWDSDVMDLTNEEWRDFLLNRLVSPLIEQGYTGLFLDTMDSYQLYAETPEQRKKQVTALNGLLKTIKEKWPDIHMISNRGFEVMDQVAPMLDAVVAESLYASWDNAKQEYGQQKPADTEWLLNKLHSIQQDHNLEIIIIDYVSPEEPEIAKKIAMQIQDQGFTPWISVPALDYIGTSMSTVEKPTVLVLYDSKQQRHLTPSTAPFDQLRIVLANGNRKINFHDTQSGLPIDSLNNRYAEIILTMNDGDLDSAYLHWLEGMEKRKHTIIRNTQGK